MNELKTRRRRITRRPVLIIAILIGITFLIFIFVKILVENNRPQSENTENTTSTKEKSTETANKTASNETKKEEKPSEEKLKKEPIVQNDGDDPNSFEALTGTISSARVINDKLSVRVMINQYLGTGNCTLKLIEDRGEAYSETVNIIPDVSTSTCEGFDVNIDKLTSNTTYLINIELESENKKGVVRGEVSL